MQIGLVMDRVEPLLEGSPLDQVGSWHRAQAALVPSSSASISPPAKSGPGNSPVILGCWPRSAQFVTAFLLGAAISLLIMRWLSIGGVGSKPADLHHRIDLNNATRAELLQVPGIGENLAARILSCREAKGGFRSVEELHEVYGIGPVTLEKLRPWVTVHTSAGSSAAGPTVGSSGGVARKQKNEQGKNSSKAAKLTALIDINGATAEELQRLPRIGPKLSQRIVDERTKAPFKSVDELRRVSGIGPKTLEGLRPYVTVGNNPVRIVTAEQSQNE